jgi:hypothetical protein
MSLIINSQVGKDIVCSQYYIGVQFPEDDERGHSYRVDYIHHNGYTKIVALFSSKDKFGEWLNTFNSRFQRQERISPFRRKKRVTNWALETLEVAYATYLAEHVTQKAHLTTKGEQHAN